MDNQPPITSTSVPPTNSTQVPVNTSPVVSQNQPSAPIVNQPKPVVGRRVFAAFIDIIILVIVLVVLGLIFSAKQKAHLCTPGHYNYNPLPTSNGTFIQQKQWVAQSCGGTSYTVSPLLAVMLGLLSLAYYTVLEWLSGGTIGKLMTGLRVSNMNNSKISLPQSLIRNVCRVIDGLPYFIPYLLGFIVIVSNHEHQRLGDKLAKTLVVEKHSLLKELEHIVENQQVIGRQQ